MGVPQSIIRQPHTTNPGPQFESATTVERIPASDLHLEVATEDIIGTVIVCIRFSGFQSVVGIRIIQW